MSATEMGYNIIEALLKGKQYRYNFFSNFCSIILDCVGNRKGFFLHNHRPNAPPGKVIKTTSDLSRNMLQYFYDTS